jgi:pyruvate kinase
MSQKDQRIVERTRSINNIRYAISYLRDAHEMAHYRELLGESCCLVAKLERQPAVDQPAAVAQWADELWVCRGDLGAELGLVRMAQAVSVVTSHLGDVSKPVFMAGQVLEHMTSHATPTRSEICYLHDILAAGYAGVVLSDETAVGAYPLDAVRTAALWKNVHQLEG